MKIIAFAGLAKAGKSTAAAAVAAMMVDNGFLPIVFQFASPLKEAAARMGFHKGGKTDHLYRAFCQEEGDRARKEDPDWFVNLMRELIDEIRKEEQQDLERPHDHWKERVLIIDDLRFHNEAEMLKEVGGHRIFISSGRRLADMEAPFRKHVSEQLATRYELGMEDDATFDFCISNNTDDEKGFLLTVTGLVDRLTSSAKEID